MTPTCSTCRHWCHGTSEGEKMRAAYIANRWRASCGKADAFHDMADIVLNGDAFVDTFEMDTPPDFGCALHEPEEAKR